MVKKLCRRVRRLTSSTEGGTHIWPIVKAIVYREVEELREVPDSQTAIARARRGCALPDLLEDVCSVRFGYERCAMAVVPRSFLERDDGFRERSIGRGKGHTCSSLRTCKSHEPCPRPHSEPTNLVGLLYGGEPLGRAFYIVRVLVGVVDESEPPEGFLQGDRSASSQPRESFREPLQTSEKTFAHLDLVRGG